MISAYYYIGTGKGYNNPVTEHPRDTLYAPTYFYRNVYNTRSAIPAISVTISAISVTISVIPVAISVTPIISAIFAILKTSAIPAPSTY